LVYFNFRFFEHLKIESNMNLKVKEVKEKSFKKNKSTNDHHKISESDVKCESKNDTELFDDIQNLLN
jgi:hypothetical protein